jgi:predicted porin
MRYGFVKDHLPPYRYAGSAKFFKVFVDFISRFTQLEAGTGKAKLTTSNIQADLDAIQFAVFYTLAKDTTLFGIYGTESIAHPTFLKKAEQKQTHVGIRYRF